MRLILQIDLANAPRLTYKQIARAIRDSLSLYQDAVSLDGPPAMEDAGIILDSDDKVGEWEVIEAPQADQGDALIALGAIAEALHVPRNRFGKLEPTPAAGYVLQELAQKYKVGGCQDTPEQCEKVALAVIAAQSSS